MALDPTINFGKATVSTGYDASATSIVLSSGHGANLPSTFSYNLVWWNSTDYDDPADDPNVEIVRCTNRVTDTLTVTRAQEGTAASTKNTGGKTYKMVLDVTKKMIDDIIATFLALAGGTMTGNIACADNEIQRALLKDYAEKLTTVAAAGATETLDIENGNAFDITLDQACTLTFSNPIASGNMASFTLLLRQNGTGGYATTWPASVDWGDGSAPTLVTTASSVTLLGFITVDGGTIWHGFVGSHDSK